MILLDREKDSAVNNTRSGRYRGLEMGEMGVKKQTKGVTYTSIFAHFLYIPVIDGTGREVCVEDSDDGGGCVSENGIINDIQEINQL